MTLVLGLLSQLKCGRLDVIMPDGRKQSFIGTERPELGADMHLHNPRAFRQFLARGQAGLADAWLAGDWTSTDAARVFELLLYNRKALLGNFRRISWTRSLVRPRKNAVQKSCEDPGNTFFAQWLDASMTYSSGLYLRKGETLEEAQHNKYASICQRLVLQPNHRVLEIGCGWGGFAEYVAREYGARVTAVTTSPAQYAYASNRIQMAGLSDRVDVQLIDYRDVPGQFDRIAGIEMRETFPEMTWPSFFHALNANLLPGGRAELQCITLDEKAGMRHQRMLSFMHPPYCNGGAFPTKTQLHELVSAAGLLDLGHITFGESYARTMRQWHRNFRDNWPQIALLGFDEHFRRIWEIYFQYCEACFETGTLDVIQKSLVKA